MKQRRQRRGHGVSSAVGNRWHGEQRRIHLRAGVSDQGAGTGEVSWAARPRWGGAGPMSGLIRKKKRREEENRKWAVWRMRPKKLFGI
jgi:hypothetical protein